MIWICILDLEVRISDLGICSRILELGRFATWVGGV